MPILRGSQPAEEMREGGGGPVRKPSREGASLRIAVNEALSTNWRHGQVLEALGTDRVRLRGCPGTLEGVAIGHGNSEVVARRAATSSGV